MNRTEFYLERMVWERTGQRHLPGSRLATVKGTSPIELFLLSAASELGDYFWL